jgi:hypothetical protein
MDDRITVEQIAELLAQEKAGRIKRRHFQMFLENPGSVFGSIISIDRSRPFNPVEFIGEGWSIVEEDERSLALTKVDISNIRLETMLKDGETQVKGEDKLLRLKASGHIRLDAKVFLALWENKEHIPESWGSRFVYFDGTVLRGLRDGRDVLYLYRDGSGWHYNCHWLGYDWSASSPSAVLVE